MTKRASAIMTVAVALFCLAACQSSPPVQEMSDARQAIAVARDAGAENSAVIELREAEAFLDSATQRLAERQYTQARRDALSAKRRALEALAASEAVPPTPR